MRRPTIAGSLITCGLLIGLVFPLAGFAQPPGPPHGPFHRPGPPGGPESDRFIDWWVEKLGLGTETLEAIDQIRDESRERDEALREQLRDGYEALHDLLNQETPDESAVMAQAETISALKREAFKNRLRATMAIRLLLAPEQRQELVRILDESRLRQKYGPLARCGDEIDKVCPQAEPGHAALKCLSDKWDDFSEECRAVFEGGRPRDFGRRPHFGPPGP